MSINPNPEKSSLLRLEKASVFIVLVIGAAVLITAGGILLEHAPVPSKSFGVWP